MQVVGAFSKVINKVGRCRAGLDSKFIVITENQRILKRAYLLITVPTTRAVNELRCNESHILTQNTIEAKCGILKRCFPCFAVELRCNTENVPSIITGDPELPSIQNLAPDINIKLVTYFKQKDL